MAGYKVSDYALGNSNWSELLATIEKQRKGFIALSLTNYDNDSLPAIASGSYVEINGALYGFSSEEAINGAPTSGSTNYIYVDPADIKPYWTTTAPIWSDSKQGWYDSGESKRYIGGCYYDGTNYTGKWIYNHLDGLTRGVQTIYGNKTFNGSIYDNRNILINGLLVYDEVVSSSFTEKTISNLDINNHGGFYRLLLSYHGTGVNDGSGYVGLRFNSIATNDYYFVREYPATNNTTGNVSFTRFNTSVGYIGDTSAGNYFIVDCIITLNYNGGYIVWVSKYSDSNKGSGDDIISGQYGGTLYNYQSNITSLTIEVSQAGANPAAIEKVRIRILRQM